MQEHFLIELANTLSKDHGEVVICKLARVDNDSGFRLEAVYDQHNEALTLHSAEFLSTSLSAISNGCLTSVEELGINSIDILAPFFRDMKELLVYPLNNLNKEELLLVGFIQQQQHASDNGLELLVRNMGLQIDNYLLQRKLREQEEKYQAYLSEVKTVKEKLLPAEDHVIEGLNYATYYRPSVGGGGDYFDIVDLRNARRRAGYENPPLTWGVGLMDVSGHGPGAAVEVAMVDAILRTYQGKMGSGPADVLQYLNTNYFTRQFRGGFITGFLCNYDASTDIFSYASAGHLPVLIKHREGQVNVLKSETGIPIGVEREYEWTTESMQLDPGDTIILFTDGITEAESISGEQFGITGLISCIEASIADNAESLMADFMNAFHKHINGVTKHDDQTLIMITIST